MDTGKKSLGEDWSFFLESPKSTALYAVPSLLERALHTLDTILDILRCGSNFRHQSLHWNTTNQYLRRDGAPIHEVC